MTCHALKISAEKDVSLSEAQSTVDGWKQDYTEVLEIERSEISVVNTEIDGSGTDYFRGMHRFDETDGKKSLLDRVENDLSAAVSWYRIEYHQCPHDGDGGACPDWTVEREGGTVPGDV